MEKKALLLSGGSSLVPFYLWMVGLEEQLLFFVSLIGTIAGSASAIIKNLSEGMIKT